MVAYQGPPDRDTVSCDVTYRITGGDNGPVIGTATVANGDFRAGQTIVQAPKDTEVAIKLTDVFCR